MTITEEKQKKIAAVCRRYFNSMRTYGEPPTSFTLRDYAIVDSVCDLIRNKYKQRLTEDLTDDEKEILRVFSPELAKFARY